MKHLFKIIAAAMGLFTLIGVARASETNRVSDLELKVKQDWGEPHRDLTVDNSPLTIAGHKYEHGLGTHANSVMRIGLNGKGEKFTAEVGVDDEQSDTGTVTFTVTGDGKKLFESGVMQSGDAPKKISVDLTGVKVLVLSVGDAGDGIDHDHADWADAKIVTSSGKPDVLDPEGKDSKPAAGTSTNAPAK